MTARVLASVLTALCLATPPTDAQEVSLEVVDSLVRAGRTDQARSILTRWIRAVDGNASDLDLQRAIWFRGILTVDPTQAVVDFQRLAVEHPGGAWTDQALLRLGRYAEARGELAKAARYYRRVVRDHPESPVRLVARAWLEENGPAVSTAEVLERSERTRPDPADVPAEPDSVVIPTPDPAEARPPDSLVADSLTGEPSDTVEPSDSARGKSAGYVIPPDSTPPDTLGREGTARARPDSTPPPAEPEQEAPVEPSAEYDFTVQVGAFAAEQGALELLRRVRDAGFAGRLVTTPGSELIRVRVGRFPDPEEATRVYDRVVAAGFDAAVVAGASSEEPIG